MDDLFENQKHCLYCKAILKGRSDKKFCSLKCKNACNNQRYKQQNRIFIHTDKYLHNNWKILAELYPLSQGEKYVDPLLLTIKAFRPVYFNGTDKESIPGKTKYLIYNYAFVFDEKLGVLIFKQNE